MYTKIALIPAYQPDENLLNLLGELENKEYKIILVNDGSDNEYNDIFLKAEKYAVVLNHSVNKGKGAALKTGLSYIQSHFCDSLIVTMDADGQHTVSDAEKIISMVSVYPEKLILGCRKLGRNAPLRSRFGNCITRLIFRLVSGASVYDTQTGLRGFSDKLLTFMLSVEGQRYEYEMNVLLQCARKKIPIEETEIQTIYINENSSSHFNTIKDSARIYGEILKFSASSFISFIVDYLLYSLFSLITSGFLYSLVFSNVFARIISSIVNYNINRKFVFKSDSTALKSAIQYFSLVALIIAGNTFLLEILVTYAKINRYTGKILTESVFFFISYIVQHFIIFKKEKE